MALRKDHGLQADNLFGIPGRVVGISMRERAMGYLLGEHTRIFGVVLVIGIRRC